jgi:tetratricopeptide (TPR) repeat protein
MSAIYMQKIKEKQMRSEHNYPNILDVYYLGYYKFLIEWASGEQTIFNTSPRLNSGSGLLYRSQELIKQFHVDPHFLYWGDKDFVIMHSDIYDESFDLDEKLIFDFWRKFPTKGLTNEAATVFISHVDCIISEESKNPQKLAEAYVWKFQLLAYQHKLAPKLLEKALAICPDMPQALLRMGLFFYYKNHYDKTKMLEYINRVIETSPTFADAWLLRACLTDNREQILSDCAEYSRLKPDSPLGYERRGLCLNPKPLQCLHPLTHSRDMKPGDKLKQDLETAIHNYTEAIRLNPSNGYYNADRGGLYLLKEKFYGMEQDHRNALSDIITFFLMFPENDMHMYKRCFDNLFCNVKTSLKEQYCTEIINTVSPEKALYWFAYLMLAQCHYEQKDSEKSLASYSFVIENAKDPIFQLLGYSLRASIYREMKDYEKALADYAVIVEHGSWFIETFIQNKDNRVIPLEIVPMVAIEKRASIFLRDKVNQATDDPAKLDRKKKAVDEYSKAIELAKQAGDVSWLPGFYKARADLYKEILELDNAIADYSAIIELDKKGNSLCLLHAYKQRIELYLKQGDKEKASEDHKKMDEASKPDYFAGEPFEIIPE